MVLGAIATVALWIAIALAEPLVESLTGHPVKDSVAARYAFMVASQAVLLIVPIRIALVWKAGPESLGLRRYTSRSLAEGVAAGVLLFFASWGYGWGMSLLSPETHARFLEQQANQLSWLAGPLGLQLGLAVLLAPFAEEVFFRGLFFGGLRGRFGFAVASGVAAAVFAVVHYPMVLAMPPLFVIGLTLATLYERHGVLAPAIMAHATYNLISLMAGPV